MDISARKSHRPRLFIGSSLEGKPLAEAIQLNLDGELDGQLDTVVWSQGLFELSRTSVESLDRISRDFEFAALVVTPDDFVESRGARRPTARDNVLFEAGLFMGRLGRERVFLVCPRDEGLGLPSDLQGMMLAQYTSASDGNLQAALGPACTRIKDAIAAVQGPIAASRSAGPVQLVPRPRRSQTLGTATPAGRNQDMRIVNISVTGALLETAGELPLGKVLDLDLRLDDGTTVTLTARVVRVQYPQWGRVGGVGVAFTAVPAPAAIALAAFVGDSQPIA